MHAPSCCGVDHMVFHIIQEPVWEGGGLFVRSRSRSQFLWLLHARQKNGSSSTITVAEAAPLSRPFGWSSSSEADVARAGAGAEAPPNGPKCFARQGSVFFFSANILCFFFRLWQRFCSRLLEQRSELLTCLAFSFVAFDFVSARRPGKFSLRLMPC